ncbi:MAG TPA: hypothetical protein VFQ90_15730 [Stellaceae bacterium]|jgi:hypothetical protein|nr:hypothetical protein [Stellaceae bacterium]
MPIPQRVQYPADIEPLVQFIEDTPPADIIDATLQKLRDGVSTQEMLTASSLAVTRSSDLPPGHHGGPLHPLAGLYAISNLVSRLEGEDRFLPVVQHVALANKHVNAPETSPYQLLEFKPLNFDNFEKAKAAFLLACNRGESLKADHIYQWIWDNAEPIEAFDLLMSIAIPKNNVDDHYFVFPGYLWRSFEAGVLDKQYLSVLMRPSVKYAARFPIAPAQPELDSLIKDMKLLEKVTRQETGDDETVAVGRLGKNIGQVEEFAEIPVMIASALARGLSLNGAGEALSIGAAGLFTRSLGGNPMDVHLHTSINLRRYLIGLPGLNLRSKLLLLLNWHLGPEIRSTAMRMEPPGSQPDMAAVKALPPRSQEALLDAITHSIYTQPPTDWSTVTNLGLMRAVPEVKHTIELAQQYVECRYDPQALIARLAEIVCHDNFTEMHAFKHHNAIVEEFRNTREPWRWMHLVAGCQAAAISFGKNMAVYEEYLDLLHAAE